MLVFCCYFNASEDRCNPEHMNIWNISSPDFANRWIPQALRQIQSPKRVSQEVPGAKSPLQIIGSHNTTCSPNESHDADLPISPVSSNCSSLRHDHLFLPACELRKPRWRHRRRGIPGAPIAPPTIPTPILRGITTAKDFRRRPT